jgi:hypothetical protein
MVMLSVLVSAPSVAEVIALSLLPHFLLPLRWLLHSLWPLHLHPATAFAYRLVAALADFGSPAFGFADPPTAFDCGVAAVLPFPPLLSLAQVWPEESAPASIDLSPGTEVS